MSNHQYTLTILMRNSQSLKTLQDQTAKILILILSHHIFKREQLRIINLREISILNSSRSTTEMYMLMSTNMFQLKLLKSRRNRKKSFSLIPMISRITSQWISTDLIHIQWPSWLIDCQRSSNCQVSMKLRLLESRKSVRKIKVKLSKLS